MSLKSIETDECHGAGSTNHRLNWFIINNLDYCSSGDFFADVSIALRGLGGRWAETFDDFNTTLI